jgi:hypothetical protein
MLFYFTRFEGENPLLGGCGRSLNGHEWTVGVSGVMTGCAASRGSVSWPKMIVMRDSIIRLIEEHDNSEVAGLMAELGYPVSPELITQKIQDISRSDIDCAYVAELEGQILGVISVHVLPLFHAVENSAE